MVSTTIETGSHTIIFTNASGYHDLRVNVTVTADSITCDSVEYGTATIGGGQVQGWDEKGDGGCGSSTPPGATVDGLNLDAYLKKTEVVEISITDIWLEPSSPNVDESFDFKVTVKNTKDTTQSVEACPTGLGSDELSCKTKTIGSGSSVTFTWPNNVVTAPASYTLGAEVNGKSDTVTWTAGAAPTGICSWINEFGVGNIKKHHTAYVYLKYKGADVGAEQEYNNIPSDIRPSKIPNNLVTRSNSAGIYLYYKDAFVGGNSETGCNFSSASNLEGREMNLIEKMLYDTEVKEKARTLAEPSQAVKEYIAKNYGDGSCITDNTGTDFTMDCQANDLVTPLPEGYTHDDMCVADILDWPYMNVDWCMEAPPAEDPPSVTTLDPDNITETGARIRAQVTSLNDNSCQVWLVYGTTTSMNNFTSKVSLSSPDTAGTTLSGLSAGTTYYVQAKASNSYGTSSGSRKSFTTEEEGDGGGATVTEEVKNWLAENYGDGTCITDDTGTDFTMDCQANDLATPLPSGYTHDSLCVGNILDWPYVNVDWCKAGPTTYSVTIQVQDADTGDSITATVDTVDGDTKNDSTPVTYSLASGNHTVTVSKSGYQTNTKSVSANKDKTVTVSLTPEGGVPGGEATLEVKNITPVNATVEIEGEVVGNAPLTKSVPAGKYISIVLNAQGYKSCTDVIPPIETGGHRVYPGAADKCRELTPAGAPPTEESGEACIKVTDVTGNILPARIFIDGGMQTELAPNCYTILADTVEIKASLDGYKSETVTKTISVTDTCSISTGKCAEGSRKIPITLKREEEGVPEIEIEVVERGCVSPELHIDYSRIPATIPVGGATTFFLYWTNPGGVDIRVRYLVYLKGPNVTGTYSSRYSDWVRINSGKGDSIGPVDLSIPDTAQPGTYILVAKYDYESAEEGETCE